MLPFREQLPHLDRILRMETFAGVTLYLRNFSIIGLSNSLKIVFAWLLYQLFSGFSMFSGDLEQTINDLPSILIEFLLLLKTWSLYCSPR